MMKRAKGGIKARPLPPPLCGPRLALHSQPAAARRLRRVFPPRPLAGEVTAWLAAREDGPGAKCRCFTLSHLLLVGEAQRFADIHFHHTRDALLLHGHADQLLGHFHRDLVV